MGKNKMVGNLVLLLVVLLVSMSGGYPVTAQTTTLSLSPVTGTALTCVDTLIAVRVENVTDLYSYDIWLEFTPASLEVIEVWEVTNGSFLSEGMYFYQDIDNEAGTIHIVMAQLAADPVSGSGDLVYIRLRALVPGATFEIKFDDDLINHPTELFTELGSPISFTSIDGAYLTADCEPAELSLSPSPVTLCVGYPYDIYVKVDNVLDLYSYDLDMTFTPGAITISSVTNAGFLSTGIQIPTVVSDRFNNTLGTINYSNTQILSGTNLPKDGSGNLIKISLQATVASQTIVFNIENTSMLSSWSDYYTAERIEYNATAGTYYTAICDPTSVNIADLTATYDPGTKSVSVDWETVSDANFRGFNVMRSDSEHGLQDRLNPELIDVYQIGSVLGNEYFFIDDTVERGKTYYYWLEVVEIDETISYNGPVSVTTNYFVYLPLMVK